ncbi:MAG: hypothetical protein PHQ60_02075 [Sideroxydans sp.]|nr:hypothetical protein [Sideroxydans sp.]MDD5056630.1 hypothetical protein [Sideroxydans sp.]
MGANESPSEESRISRTKMVARLPVAKDFKDPQLCLFQNFLCNTDNERQRLSNSIELWDAVPRYSISRQAMTKMRDEHGNLPLLQLDFEYRGTKFSASIQATQIEERDEKGKSKRSRDGKLVTTAYYPSSNEELVEEALRKLAVDQEQGFLINKRPTARSGVVFSLYQLREELRQRGHSRSFDEIKLSLDILSGSNIKITANSPTSVDLSFGKSNYLTALIGVTRKDMKIDADKKWMAQFHPLVTECMDSLSYRQFNYHQLMSHTTQLARWLHKQLILKYTFASRFKTFEIRFSTVKRDSAMLDSYSRPRDAHGACDIAINELVEHGVLAELGRRIEAGLRGKVLDVVYTLVPSNEFVAEVKAANKRLEEKL